MRKDWTTVSRFSLEIVDYHASEIIATSPTFKQNIIARVRGCRGSLQVLVVLTYTRNSMIHPSLELELLSRVLFK